MVPLPLTLSALLTSCTLFRTVGGIHAAFILPPGSAYASVLPLTHGLLDAGHNVTILGDDWTLKKVRTLVPAADYESLGPTSRPEMSEGIIDVALRFPLPLMPLWVYAFLTVADVGVGTPLALKALPILERKQVDVLGALFLTPSHFALGEVLGVPVVGLGIGLLSTSLLSELVQPVWSQTPTFGSFYTSAEIQNDPFLLMWNTAVRLFGKLVRSTVGVAVANVNRARLGAPGFELSQFGSLFRHPFINPTLPEMSPEYPAWSSFLGEPLGIYDHPALHGGSMARSAEQDEIMAWLDAKARANSSVLYVSYGSEVILNKRHLELLLETFTAGKNMSVLWSMKKRPASLQAPSNIFITAWAPQKAVLAHPAVKAFLSHGGGNSAREALAAGTPVLAMPYFGDQPNNAMVLEELGVGIRVHRDYFTPESLRRDVRRITSGAHQERAAHFKALNDRRVNLSRAVEIFEDAARRPPLGHGNTPAGALPGALAAAVVLALASFFMALLACACRCCFGSCARCIGRRCPRQCNGKVKPE